MEIKDMHGNVLDEWPTCIVCESPLGYWDGDRYFCKTLGCPAHCLPQELLYVVEKDDLEGLVTESHLDEVIAEGFVVARAGVGAKVVGE